MPTIEETIKRAFALLAALSAGAVGAAPVAMNPGLWQIITSTEMPGVGLAMPPTKIEHCYSAEDVKDLRRTLPKKPNCKIADWKQSGSTVTWKASCIGDTAATMTGSMKFAGDRSSGAGKISVSKGGRVLRMNQKYDAHRIGACK